MDCFFHLPHMYEAQLPSGKQLSILADFDMPHITYSAVIQNVLGDV